MSILCMGVAQMMGSLKACCSTPTGCVLEVYSFPSYKAHCVCCIQKIQHFRQDVHFTIFLLETNVGVMVFLELITENSIILSRRDLIQYKRPSVFCLFTCLGLF